MRNFIKSIVILFAIISLTNNHTFAFSIFSSIKHQDYSEKLLLSTDRSIYIAGDYIFFKLNLFSTYKNTSEFAYVILTNQSNKVIKSITIPLNNQGFSQGSILIPDTIKNGLYTVTAYTNFIKQVQPEGNSSRELLIINKFDDDYTHVIDDTSKFIFSNNHQAGLNSNIKGNVNIRLLNSGESIPARTEVKLLLALDSLLNDSISSISVSVAEKSSHFINKPSKPNFFPSKTNTVNYSQLSRLVEKNGIILSGKIVGNNANDSLGSIPVFLSCNDSIPNLLYSITDSNGGFNFLLNRYYEGKTIRLGFKDLETFKKYQILLDDKYVLLAKSGDTKNIIDSSIFEYINKNKEIISIHKSYNLTKTTDITDNRIFRFVPNVYNIPDFVLNTKDFAQLKNLYEISRELIPSLRIEKTNEHSTPFLLDSRLKTFFGKPPVIFINGLQTVDFDRIVNFGSEEITRIELINSSWIFGSITFPGILSIYTKAHTYDVEDNKSSTQFYCDIIQSESDYKQQSYNSENVNKRNPDFRSLLFWKPNLSLTKKPTEISFYTSDLASCYLIKVEGITKNGNYIFGEKEFNVISKIK